MYEIVLPNRRRTKEKTMKQYKRRVFEIIQIGKDQDLESIVFDFFIAGVIVVNLFVTLFETFEAAVPYMGLLKKVDAVTMLIFAVEYGLRLWTAEYLYPQKYSVGAKVAYVFSFYGLIDLFLHMLKQRKLPIPQSHFH